VRELRNTDQRAADAAEGGTIGLGQLGGILPADGGRVKRRRAVRGDGADDAQAALEALRATGGNVSAAARRLGVDRSTVYRRMKRLGMVEKPG